MMMFTDAPQRRRPALEEHAADPVVQRILFATDGGEAGSGALKWIAQRAKMHRLNVAVVTVVEQDWLTEEMTGDRFTEAAQRVVAEAEEYLARWAPSAEVTTRVGRGNARETFAEASAALDLLVVGTHRTGRFPPAFGGSFPLKLVESARCPVVVVPKAWKPTHGAVVVGILGDGSDEAALAFAVHEARVLHRELRVVHSWTLPTMLATEGAVDPAPDDGAIADTHDGVLSRTLAGVRAAESGVVVRGVLAQGEAAEVLDREALGEELLVVGSHGWSVVDRFFLGSVSRGVLARPSCPVAVVRPHRAATTTG